MTIACGSRYRVSKRGVLLNRPIVRTSSSRGLFEYDLILYVVPNRQPICIPVAVFQGSPTLFDFGTHVENRQWTLLSQLCLLNTENGIFSNEAYHSENNGIVASRAADK